jgi:Pyruvate/2-oxoacid:ferredoxin oxidoreductase delta subunit
MEVDTIITAVSQSPDTNSLGAFQETGWPEADDWGRTPLDAVWSGGDNLNLGIATTAIGQGHKAAKSMHANLRGEEVVAESHGPDIGPDRLKIDFYEAQAYAERLIMSAEARLKETRKEIDSGISKDQVLEEVKRCFSCGACFGCERCWMYCTPGCISKVTEPTLGNYYKINIDTCNGCKKCAEECPCGFLDMV